MNSHLYTNNNINNNNINFNDQSGQGYPKNGGNTSNNKFGSRGQIGMGAMNNHKGGGNGMRVKPENGRIMGGSLGYKFDDLNGILGENPNSIPRQK